MSMTFEASDPGFEQRVRDNFQSQGVMHTLGMKMLGIAPGKCELLVAFSDELAQQYGYFHGGVIATLADVSGGYAAFSLLPADRTSLTVEFKLNPLSPGKGEKLSATATFIKYGRTLTVCRSDVFVHSEDGAQAVCATALATYMAVDLR